MMGNPKDYEDKPGDTPSMWEKFFSKTLFYVFGKPVKRGPVVLGLITLLFPAGYYKQEIITWLIGLVS